MTAMLSGTTRGMTLVPPVLRKNALRVADPALRGHPLFGVEAVPVERLLGFVDRHPARERVDERLQRLPVEQGARRACHQERGCRDAGSKGAEVVVGEGAAYGLGARRKHPKIIVDLLERIRLCPDGQLGRLIEERRGGHHVRRAPRQRRRDERHVVATTTTRVGSSSRRVRRNSRPLTLSATMPRKMYAVG